MPSVAFYEPHSRVTHAGSAYTPSFDLVALSLQTDNWA